jgi:hypothetical protein
MRAHSAASLSQFSTSSAYMTGYDFTLIVTVFHAVEINAKHFARPPTGCI